MVSVSWPTAEISGIVLSRGRAHDGLVVEGHQIFDRAAAARDDQQIGPRHCAARLQRVEAADRGGDLGRRALALHRHGPQQHAARKAIASSRCMMSRITAPVGDVTTPITSGRNGSFFLRARVEQAFGGELLLALLQHRHQRAEAGQLDLLDDDLVARRAGIGRDPAGADDLEPRFRLHAAARARSAPDDGVQDRLVVLEVEIDMAGGLECFSPLTSPRTRTKGKASSTVRLSAAEISLTLNSGRFGGVASDMIHR